MEHFIIFHIGKHNGNILILYNAKTTIFINASAYVSAKKSIFLIHDTRMPHEVNQPKTDVLVRSRMEDPLLQKGDKQIFIYQLISDQLQF